MKQRKHFADLAVGDRFLKNGIVFEKIEPIFSGTGNRRRLRANFRNVETGGLCRGALMMVDVVEK